MINSEQQIETVVYIAILGIHALEFYLIYLLGKTTKPTNNLNKEKGEINNEIKNDRSSRT
jgi:hypothetical protein